MQDNCQACCVYQETITITMCCPKLVELPPPPPGKTGWPWTEETPPLPETMSDGSSWPRISIVTPSYNQGQFIEETIRSVLLQGYPNLEYIIIDGGSTDNSVEIIKKYEPWLAYWVSEKDDGQTFAIQKGMEVTNGEILNWLNSDDYLLPGALHSVAASWCTGSNNAGIFVGDGISVNLRGELIRERRVSKIEDPLLPIFPKIAGGIQASWFFTRQAWEQVNGINVALNYTMDTDLYIRIFNSGFEIIQIQQALAAYRNHLASKTLSGWKQSISYKKTFYQSWVNKLPAAERPFYQKKINRLISKFFLSSIAENDNYLQRVYKAWLAIVHSPLFWIHPRYFWRIVLVIVKPNLYF